MKCILIISTLSPNSSKFHPHSIPHPNLCLRFLWCRAQCVACACLGVCTLGYMASHGSVANLPGTTPLGKVTLLLPAAVITLLGVGLGVHFSPPRWNFICLALVQVLFTLSPSLWLHVCTCLVLSRKHCFHVPSFGSDAQPFCSFSCKDPRGAGAMWMSQLCQSTLQLLILCIPN